MTNLIRSLIEALNPCIHQWEKIDVLHDDPKNPSQTTIIRMCSICGTLNTVDIKGPPKPIKPDTCPPHVWVTTNDTRIIDDINKPEAKRLTMGHIYTQSCKRCGDYRKIDTRLLGPEGIAPKKEKRDA